MQSSEMAGATSGSAARRRTAVVTGGASGMGADTCRVLAGRGYRVAVADVDGDGAHRVAEELRASGAESVGVAVDVTDRVLVDDAFAKVRSELGPIEVLVTSAGLVAFDKFSEITAQSWTKVIDVNLNGTFHCCQAVIDDMVAGGWGRIVTISSSSAQRGSPGMAHYAASKGAVIALTKSLAREYARSGITVNTIPPSGIETPMQHQSQAMGNLPSNEVMVKAIPVGHLGSGYDIASTAAFLCSEEAGYITGQVVGVNGGSVI
ncbi:SDR family NAD(P)-dependent oxidoreductase [Williamsia sp.]|uniref:SDR family NAD(P)-dependent oxidoreductase n=1 Tax=Williamsia sp. TaxID=1872085 RepID=UPI002F93A085